MKIVKNGKASKLNLHTYDLKCIRELIEGYGTTPATLLKNS